MRNAYKSVAVSLKRYHELVRKSRAAKNLIGTANKCGPPENPRCGICGARMLRWGWYEAKNEAIKYWYCLECDKAGRAPYIQVKPNPDYILEEQV